MGAYTANLLYFFAIAVFAVNGDTIANCTYEEIRGSWTFMIGESGFDSSLQCTANPPVVSKLTVTLYYPNMAVDELGNFGYWTLIYNQGFEVRINGRSYFAFSMWDSKGQSICNETIPGWTHDDTGHDWACFYGLQHSSGSLQSPKTENLAPRGKPLVYNPKRWRKFGNNAKLIETINTVQSSWKARSYPEYEEMSRDEIYRRAGGYRSSSRKVSTAPVTKEHRALAAALPDSFDWRNVRGQSFVTPVRNQGGCGSCYSFATMGMLEARNLIRSNGSTPLIFSPQNIVDCCEYSQGCDGGFGYLVGKYAQDFGVVEESCYPYQGSTKACKLSAGCKRHYAHKYGYVGGYYGACNEVLMKIALVLNGPMVVNFEVYDDFLHYQSGVYHHVTQTRELGLQDFNPFVITNHAVLLVGYGVDQASGLPFWSIKNSWSTTWGEQGYFRILRGTDECGVESMAEEAFPID